MAARRKFDAILLYLPSEATCCSEALNQLFTSRLLIPLNICRREKYYLPWECEHERHTYEKCQYDDYVSRMKELSKLKRQQAEELES